MYIFLFKVFNLFEKAYYITKRKYMLSKFAAVGTNFSFDPRGSRFSCENIYIGNHVNIGYNADFIATRSKIIIGEHVIFAPHVSIRGGDHRYDVIGRYIDNIKDSEKLPENDQNVFFEGDNWVGMNVTILKGVIIGRGAIIAAGTIVTRNIPAYCIFGGVPGRVLKYRFSEEQIIEHEFKLYNYKK